MKRIILLAAIVAYTKGQLMAQVEYVNYSSYVNAIANFIKAGDTTIWKQAIKTLERTAKSAKEEMPVQLPTGAIKPGTRSLSDEAIFSKRKSSVLVIGRLIKTSGTNINFDVLGTGFLISKEGHCVTNLHVLPPISSANELAYFVITEDKNCYVIKELLAYSKNNDLAILSIDAKGRQFDPLPIGKPAAVGATVYCISHPAAEMFYFSKGIVNRNVARDSTSLGTIYSADGKTPIRMEVSADYGGGSSGGPIIDRYGNLVGIVATTNTVYLNETQAGGVQMHPQMVMRSTIPVKALIDLVK